MATLTGLLDLHSILCVMEKVRQYLSSKLAITHSAGTPISHGAVSKTIMNNKERQLIGDKLIPTFSVFRLGSQQGRSVYLIFYQKYDQKLK